MKTKYTIIIAVIATVIIIASVMASGYLSQPASNSNSQSHKTDNNTRCCWSNISSTSTYCNDKSVHHSSSARGAN